MNRILTKWQALSAVIMGAAFVAVLTVFPLRLWSEPIASDSNRIEAGTVELSRLGPAADQMFVAQYDHLDGIDLLVVSSSPKASFTVNVYDENWVKKRKEGFKAVEQGGPFQGRVYVPLNLDTKVGKQYYYRVNCTKGKLQLAYEVTETSGFIYNGPCHVGEEALGGCNLITGYHYGQPLRKGKSALVILLILASALGITGIMRMVAKKTGKLTDLVTLQWGFKKICNPLIILGTVAGVIAVGPLYLFSYQYFDIATFVLGTVFLGIILWYLVNRTYARTGDLAGWEYVKDRLPHALQSLCLAMALLACIHYMNGLYEVFHDIAYREMLCWLALAMIVTYSKEELFNWWNAAGILAAVLWAVRYYRLWQPDVANEYEMRVLKLTCYLAVLLVIVVIHTVLSLIRKKVRYINSFYGLVTAALLAGMICMRNGRWWPVMMAVAFSLFGLYFAAWDKKDRFLDNVLNGILLNFAGCTAYCLMHRPYMAFLYIRYSHIFHTVTVTATYMAVVMAAALVKLLSKYKKEKKWQACFLEITIFGAAACYVLFTISRTGIICAAVMGIVVWLVFADGGCRERLRKLLGSAGMVIFAVLFLFPVCFTWQRIIPAVVKQPIEFAEIETFVEPVFTGKDLRSEAYVTLDRFVEVFADKMLGIPEGAIELYYYRVSGESTAWNFGGNKRPSPMPYFDDFQDLDYTNGRTDIYKSYWEQLTMEGHEEMGALLEDGSIAVHAHNIYLQFAFDHGIIMGIAFVVWVMITLVQALLYFYRNRDRNAAALPFAVTVLFVAAGVVEWIAHPCNPVGFVLLLILMPLLFEDTKKKDESKKETTL